MKTCACCGEQKPDIMFHKSAATKDGLQGWCKACKRESYGANESYRIRARATVKEYDALNADKSAARRAVKKEMEAGRMEYGPCEVCGTEHGRIDAHHDSYHPDDWLKVRYLCRKHHLQHHREEKARLKKLREARLPSLVPAVLEGANA
jgi:hypothetical protein